MKTYFPELAEPVEIRTPKTLSSIQKIVVAGSPFSRFLVCSFIDGNLELLYRSLHHNNMMMMTLGIIMI